MDGLWEKWQRVVDEIIILLSWKGRPNFNSCEDWYHIFDIFEFNARVNEGKIKSGFEFGAIKVTACSEEELINKGG